MGGQGSEKKVTHKKSRNDKTGIIPAIMGSAYKVVPVLWCWYWFERRVVYWKPMNKERGWTVVLHGRMLPHVKRAIQVPK